MARDEKVVFRLNTVTRDKLKEMAEERGITMSALIAYIIGSWVKENDVKNSLGDIFAEAMTGEMVAFYEEMNEKMSKNLEEMRRSMREKDI